jgi:hypothetical protein
LADAIYDVNFALVLTILMLCAGLAIDGGVAQWQKRAAQTAADAAAVGALIEQQRGGTDWVSAGQADAALNGFTSGQQGVTVTFESPPTSGSYSGQSGAIQATVSKAQPTIFMRIFQVPIASIVAKAVAKTGSPSSCLYALDQTASPSISNVGSGAITAGCGTYINSSASNALSLVGSGSLTATSVSIVGGYSLVGSGTISPTPVTGSKTVTDPLASLIQPTFTACTYTNFSIVGSSPQTLSPGTYCGGISITGSSSITLQPGLYIITGGVSWVGSPAITGTGVTLFFTKGGGSGYGTVSIVGTVNLSLSAPTVSSNGAIAGVLMFGDRSWNNTSSNVSVDGSASTKLEGLLYFPTTGISFVGSTTCHGKYLGVVADTMTMVGSATLNVPTPDYSSLSGGSPFQGGTVGLVE